VFVEEIANMLDFDKKGIEVSIKDNLKVRGKHAAGHYLPWTRTISINRAVTSFWFSTFSILLHEYKHYLQRTRIFVSMATCGIGSLGIWYYGMLVDSYLFIYGSFVGVVFTVLFYLYFEFDARRFERSNLPDIMLILLVLEYTLITQILGLDGATRHNLASLNKVIKNRAPYLFVNKVE
jgi:hypothetical protein